MWLVLRPSVCTKMCAQELDVAGALPKCVHKNVCTRIGCGWCPAQMILTTELIGMAKFMCLHAVFSNRQNYCMYFLVAYSREYILYIVYHIVDSRHWLRVFRTKLIRFSHRMLMTVS